jgi:hypothetical protein
MKALFPSPGTFVSTGRLVAGCVVLLFSICGSIFSPEPGHAQETASTKRVEFEARLIDDGTPIWSGIEWRIFGSEVGDDGKLPLFAQAEGGTKAFDITPGEYFVHAAYGHASAIRRVVVERDNQQEVFTFNAGALQLASTTGNGNTITAGLLRFDIYSSGTDSRGERQLIARNVRPGEIVPFPAGIYHVISQYGRLNAEIRADLRVEPGKITQATMQHRAARISFRLVEQTGGDAIADTAWSILTESGDVITESSSAFPSFVLNEGTYTAIARNTEKIYSRDFKVVSGENQVIELLVE